MKVIIVGSGRMGSGLVKQLTKENHKVTVIDTNEDVLKETAKNAQFTAVVGIGFDKDVLEKAGIKSADALVSCTNSDETNALIARISKNMYHVPRVIARLFDPDKAKIYSALGIETISTTSWGINRASELINYSELDTIISVGSGEVEIVKIEVPALLVGRTIEEINVIGEIRVISVYRNNKAFIPTSGSVLQANDILYISVLSNSIKRLKTLLGLH
ncbi:trk system potassium uptake protein TrkA [Breznakia sp. PF5-3]|uniref:potassium channel family protein n=1 Tax=unclassified Breznakia TaxID=2623764 RepID=UPI0024068FA4|nr:MULTISPECIES: TrkA family potassium uptake protein [unclassified Breznakia]MDL2276605.1 TrkA family potassium uptake protein [Breznakia sp. OttesenSCG-928-G09]MDF9824649.1 trk system potassium uptake protein TrkA [Breznakia sp. PM6-1]MDF9835634.1 trk system potassium uptake protein TrkA [Breznakia sp. PF5-3]MDF9837701.1 trk system potassium uptake protein TrkA [Breznakia sp. PFB2-8]MDF9859565.1 trk system potassium uptake protein TrkA [Breznakia sp. PH5-24]